MPTNPLVKSFPTVTPFFNGASDRYLFLIVVGMFLVGAVMAVVELLQWWKRQTELYIKPPSRFFNLLSSTELRETLNSLSAIRTTADWGLIVVNNNSADDTRTVITEAARNFPAPGIYSRSRRVRALP